MKKGNSNGFLQSILDSIFGKNDADAEKRRQLKNIAKKLSKSRYNKFYKFQGNEALPTLAKFMYEIYKVIYPAQTMFQSVANPNVLKRLSIDFLTTEEIRNIEESISEENLIKMSKEIPIANLQSQAQERISTYSDFFTLEKITEIDGLYKQLICMKDFCTFDFYFFLKKFNKGMREADFNTMPNFEKINAEYILGELKDFMAAAWTLPLDIDWTNCIKLLRAYKGVEPVTLQNWKKVIQRIQSLKSSGTFEMMIKLISSDPSATVELSDSNPNIIEPHLDKIKGDAEKTINQLIAQEKAHKTGDICSQLFPNIEISSLKNYSENWNTTLKHKRLETFNNVEALSYLKTFLLEIFKKNIREYYDIVLVRGQWETQPLCTSFSDAYNSLLQTADQIIQFDSELAEDGPIGIKIKTLLPKTDRDSSSKNIVNRLVNDANEAAYKFIVTSTRNLITMGKIIKTLIEDYGKPKAQIIGNWKELDKYSEVPLKDVNMDLYKKIYLFSTLIKESLTKMEEEA